MSFSYRHQGAELPVTLHLDEDQFTRPCPTCARLERDGTVTVRAAVERESGSTPAMCTAGHMVLVAWRREPADGAAPTATVNTDD